MLEAGAELGFVAEARELVLERVRTVVQKRVARGPPQRGAGFAGSERRCSGL